MSLPHSKATKVQQAVSLGSEALDHGRYEPSKPKRPMSDDSIQVGEVLPYGGKVRSMIKKLLPWAKKDGNSPGTIYETFTGALVGREHLGCEVVYEGEGDIRAEYVFNTLGRYTLGINIHLTTQYNPCSRTARSS